ncbi:hypothetical protein OSB04_007087 [Centaurea solstitialis]|uniref:Uncharacterized protein n=1 Tax=Centaurea solstitialis TaxID=347529 RepID=A0AA38U2H2_9ASTR|nr:hypothetical protein OSB04_007087 [Centaurea solstitialis]
MNKGIKVTDGTTSEQAPEDVTSLDSNHSINSPGDNGTPRKRVRGPTFMPKIWARPEGDRIHVLFNEYGQPIDKDTTTISWALWQRSGKFCPVDTSWHQVKKAKKEILLQFIKDKFDLPPGSDDWLLKSFGKKVRNWRARIKEDFYDPSLSLQELKSAKPNRVRVDQWENLLEEWNKEESKGFYLECLSFNPPVINHTNVPLAESKNPSKLKTELVLTGVTLKCLPPCYGVAVERTKYSAVLMISNQIPQIALPVKEIGTGEFILLKDGAEGKIDPYFIRPDVRNVLAPPGPRIISVGKDFYQSHLTDMTPRSFRDNGNYPYMFQSL